MYTNYYDAMIVSTDYSLACRRPCPAFQCCTLKSGSACTDQLWDEAEYRHACIWVRSAHITHFHRIMIDNEIDFIKNILLFFVQKNIYIQVLYYQLILECWIVFDVFSHSTSYNTPIQQQL